MTSVRDDDLCEQVTMRKPQFELESEYQADYWLVGTSNFVEDLGIRIADAKCISEAVIRIAFRDISVRPIFRSSEYR